MDNSRDINGDEHRYGGADPFIDKFLDFLKGRELLLELTLDEYLSVKTPFPETKYSTREVTSRYYRNGYDWDIHGTLYTPERESIPGISILMVHGSGVNESTFDKTPNGRAGWARVIASHGFKVLSVSYPGQWLPESMRKKPSEDRTPSFLFDREIGADELRERMLRYTFSLVAQGITTLAEQNLVGSNMIAFGHSLGGRLIIELFKFLKKGKIVGILGYGSHGPAVWGNQLQDRLREKRGEKLEERKPTFEELTSFRRLLPGFREPRIYMPVIRSVSELEECAKITGLPREEYLDSTLTKEPDPVWLRNIKVLFMVGENDSGLRTAIAHWPKDQPLEDRPAYYFAKKFAASTLGAHLVVIPNHTHFGHLEDGGEKIVYLWFWAIKCGYFKNEIDS